MAVKEREQEVIYPREEDRISPFSTFLLGFLVCLFVALVGFMVNMSYQVPPPSRAPIQNDAPSEAMPQGPSSIPLAPHAMDQPGTNRSSIQDNNPMSTGSGRR